MESIFSKGNVPKSAAADPMPAPTTTLILHGTRVHMETQNTPKSQSNLNTKNATGKPGLMVHL